ncbi:MAG TPA: hypothetical protein VGB95_03665 [Chitinophagales bacterium]
MKKKLILFLLLFGFTTEHLLACSCIGESTTKDEYMYRDIVLSGTIIEIQTDWEPDSTAIKDLLEMGIAVDSFFDQNYLRRYYTKNIIKIDRVYKGKIHSDTLTIYTGMSSGDCGFPFKQGGQYIVYGYKHKGNKNNYWTSICTRTKRYDPNEAAELKRLSRK